MTLWLDHCTTSLGVNSFCNTHRNTLCCRYTDDAPFTTLFITRLKKPNRMLLQKLKLQYNLTHIHTHAYTHTLTSLPGLRLRQLGWNLLTWRTWMAHLMLRWWSWLVTLRNNKSFWGGEESERWAQLWGGKRESEDWTPRGIFWDVNLNPKEVKQTPQIPVFWKCNYIHDLAAVWLSRHSYTLTTVRYCSICPSTLPSLNWSLYWGRPMSSSQPLGHKMSQFLCGGSSAWSSVLFQCAFSTYEWPRCNRALQTSQAACCWTSWWLTAASSCGAGSSRPAPETQQRRNNLV